MSYERGTPVWPTVVNSVGLPTLISVYYPITFRGAALPHRPHQPHDLAQNRSSSSSPPSRYPFMAYRSQFRGLTYPDFGPTSHAERRTGAVLPYGPHQPHDLTQNRSFQIINGHVQKLCRFVLQSLSNPRKSFALILVIKAL